MRLNVQITAIGDMPEDLVLDEELPMPTEDRVIAYHLELILRR